MAGIGIAAGLTALAGQLGQAEPQRTPGATSRPGGQVALRATAPGQVFRDADLSGSAFENVNLSKTRLHDVNLSDLSVTAANLGGAHFKHLGPAPDATGKQERQRAVTFEEAQLCDSTFRKVDLSNVKIVDCNLQGMTIDGVPVTAMIAAYKKARR
jgi:uncharacterized protein YjbI with pentapeptide repeats